MKILNFGSANIDFVYSVNNFVTAGETITADTLNKFAGGKGLNQSIALARSGEKVFHAGCIGTDGVFLEQLLKKSGVDTRYLKTVNLSSGHAVIQVNQTGENCIILCAGANFAVEKDFIDLVFKNFGKGDILLLQNEISNLDYIVDTAHKKDLKIILNPSPFNDAVKALDLSHIDTLVLNEIEASQISGKKEKAEFLDFFKTNYPQLNIMLTLGSCGCVYINAESGRIYHYPAFSVNVVDTTAAGDTFTGYFVSGVARGLPIDETLKIASVAAALAVSKQGAAPSIPLKSEVEKALLRLKPLLNF